jgi:hypothetical protein
MKHVGSRVQNISEDCNWTYSSDIIADEFVEWRARQVSLSPKTHNDYLNSFCALQNWMEKQERIKVNRLEKIEGVRRKGSCCPNKVNFVVPFWLKIS